MAKHANGRPALPPGLGRTEQVRLRLTPAEKDELFGAAPPGLVAEWMREVLLRAARRQPTRKSPAR